MANAQLALAVRHLRKLVRPQAAKDLPDRQLLEDFSSCHVETAFTAIVDRYGGLVLSVCRRVLHHEQDAEDAFQATFLVLARKAGAIRRKEALPSWLHGVAYHLAMKAKRGIHRRRNYERQAPTMRREKSDLALRELQAIVDEELQSFPVIYRAPFVLCCLDGQSKAEAARQLGWKEGTVSGRLARARRKMQQRLLSRGVSLSAVLGALALTPNPSTAGVPGLLPASTVKAALADAAGQAVPAGMISAGADLLLRSVSSGMFVTKSKLATLLWLAAVVATIGVGAMGRYALAQRKVRVADPAVPATAEAQDRGEKSAKKASQLPPTRLNQKGEVARRLDPDGRPLPAGALHRLGSRRFRVEGCSDFILPTPDGKYVLVHPQPALSASAAQGLMLLDADTGLRVRAFEDSRRVPKVGVHDAIRPAAFSPDGKKLYALAWHKSEKDGDGFAQWANFDNPCKRALLVWDVATGKFEAEWDLPAGGIVGASLLGLNVSPDGRRLYVYGAIRIGSLFNRNVRGVAGLHVLDAATGKKLQTWEGAGYPVGMIAGGKEVITFGNGTGITARDAETGKPIRTFSLAGFVPSVTLSPDGKMVAAVGIRGYPGPRSYEIKVWETATGREIRKFTTDAEKVQASIARLLFARDGKTLYLGTALGRILRWDLSNGQALSDWRAHHGMIADLHFRPGQNELVSSGESDGALRRWDAVTGKLRSTTDAYVGEIAVAGSPGGKEIAAVDGAGRLDVWDVTTGRITKTLQTPGRNRHKLLFTPDGKLLLMAAETGPNTIWDLSAGKQIGEFSPPPKPDTKPEHYWGTLCFSPDGRRLLASKFGRGTWMWTWPERKILWHEVKEQRELECCCFLDSDTMVGADWHNAIEFREPETGIVKRSLQGGAAHLAFSRDRRRMVTANLGGEWQLRDGITRTVLKEVKGSQYFWCVDFSPSGWLLAVAGDNSVRVYDTASWQEVARFDGHEGTVRTVFFGSDDGTLISASAEDGTALVWSLRPTAHGGPPDPAKIWADLAGDGPAIRQAVWAAAQHPDQAIQLFREKWPVPQHPVDAKRARKLIGDLDGERFADREAAQAELTKLGRQAEGELRKALAQTTSLEVKRRAKTIVDRWSPPATAEYSAEDARELRAVWALELAGTSEAKKLLAEWAAAKVGNRLCEEAAAALKRLPR